MPTTTAAIWCLVLTTTVEGGEALRVRVGSDERVNDEVCEQLE